MEPCELTVIDTFDIVFSHIISPGMDPGAAQKSLFDVLQVLDHNRGNSIRELVAQCAVFTTQIAQPSRAEKKRLGSLNCARTG